MGAAAYAIAWVELTERAAIASFAIAGLGATANAACSMGAAVYEIARVVLTV